MSNMYVPPPQPNPNIDIGNIFSQAWKHFTRQITVWLIAAAILLAVLVVYLVVVFGVVMVSASNAATTAYGTTATTFAPSLFALLILLLGSVLMMIFTWIFGANSYRNAVHAVQGGQIAVGDFFKLAGIGKPIVVTILYFIIIAIGTLAFILPGIVLSFLLCFVPISVWANPQLSVGEVFSDAFETFKRNPGISIVMVLLTGVISGVAGGTLIGSLFALPFIYLAMTITYFAINQRQFMVLQ